MILLRLSIPVIIMVSYFIAAAQAEGAEQVVGQNLTFHDSDIRVALDHIFISKKNNSLEVSEIVVFRNEGKEIYYTKDNHTFFAVSTPVDAKNLKTQVMECCLVQEEGMVYMDPMQSIPQGSNFEMQISYTIFPEGPQYVFNKSAVYNTTSVLMFIDKKSGMRIDGSNETITLGGNEFKVIGFNDLKAGESVSIPVKLTAERDYPYAQGAVFLILAGLIYGFRKNIFRRTKKEHTLEELEIEKKNIFRTIYRFEKQSEGSEELKKLIEEYRQKAIRIFIEIDKLNDKCQSEEKGMEQKQ